MALSFRRRRGAGGRAVLGRARARARCGRELPLSLSRSPFQQRAREPNHGMDGVRRSLVLCVGERPPEARARPERFQRARFRRVVRAGARTTYARAGVRCLCLSHACAAEPAAYARGIPQGLLRPRTDRHLHAADRRSPVQSGRLLRGSGPVLRTCVLGEHFPRGGPHRRLGVGRASTRCISESRKGA